MVSRAGKRLPSQHRGRIGRRLVVTFVVFVFLVIGSTGWILYHLTRNSLERQMSDQLLAIAQLSAAGIDGDAVRHLRSGFEGGNLHARLRAKLVRYGDLVGARRIYVFDDQGQSLLDTAPDVPIGREYTRLRVDREELADVWRGQASHSVLFRDKAGVYYQSGYAPVYAGEEVVAAVGVDIGAGFVEAIRAFQRSVLIFGGVSVVLTIVIGLVLARTLTGPIHRLVNSAQAIGEGDLERPVDRSAGDELGYLGQTMEEMRLKILDRDEHLRQMLAGVAHEIRNPLGGIEIYAGLIASDLPDGDARKAHIQKVTGEVRTLNRVISEFLDFARPSVVQPVEADVARLVEEVVFLLSPEMDEAGVQCIREIPQGLKVFVDVDQFKRALVNLVKNGVQAMPEGGVLRLTGEKENGNAVIRVADTGVGMDNAVIERLFEPFFTMGEGGSGLGMAIVQKTVKENGGTVGVESQVGRGTVFEVILPGSQKRGEGYLRERKRE